MTTKKLIAQLRKERKSRLGLMRLARRLDGLNLGHTSYRDRVIVYIKDVEELGETRRKLRRALGSWTDQVGQVWCSGNTASVSWTCDDHESVQIWMTAVPIDEFPEDLKKSGCGFVEVQNTEMAYVCKVKGVK